MTDLLGQGEELIDESSHAAVDDSDAKLDAQMVATLKKYLPDVAEQAGFDDSALAVSSETVPSAEAAAQGAANSATAQTSVSSTSSQPSAKEVNEQTVAKLTQHTKKLSAKADKYDAYREEMKKAVAEYAEHRSKKLIKWFIETYLTDATSGAAHPWHDASKAKPDPRYNPEPGQNLDSEAA